MKDIERLWKKNQIGFLWSFRRLLASSKQLAASNRLNSVSLPEGAPELRLCSSLPQQKTSPSLELIPAASCTFFLLTQWFEQLCWCLFGGLVGFALDFKYSTILLYSCLQPFCFTCDICDLHCLLITSLHTSTETLL